MADDSLDKSYLDIVDSIVMGATRTHPNWLLWFQETPAQGHFETRIKAVFDDRGHIPSAVQFFRAKDDILADQAAKADEANGPDPRVTKAEPKTKATKKDSESDGDK